MQDLVRVATFLGPPARYTREVDYFPTTCINRSPQSGNCGETRKNHMAPSHSQAGPYSSRLITLYLLLVRARMPPFPS